MDKLSPIEIECLLGFRESDQHILELLGYGFTTEGQKRFRTERPNLYKQISAFIADELTRSAIFPSAVDPMNPGSATFINRKGHAYSLSSLEEIGIGKFKRFETPIRTESDAIREYVRRVANLDYIRVEEADE